MRLRRSLVAIVLGIVWPIALAPARLAAQSTRSTLVATVGEGGSGAFLEGAEVVMPQLRRVARTNALGEAVIRNVPRGDFVIRVRRLGHVPAEVTMRFTGSDSVGAVFMLDLRAASFDTVRITARRVPLGVPEAFVTRQQMGIGRFLVAQDLEPEGDREFVTVAQVKLPGLRRMVRPDGSTFLATMRGSCGTATPFERPTRGGARPAMASSCGGDACPIRVLLDEMDITNEDQSFLVRTWDLAGAEFYSAASAPARYRDGRAGCGIMLLWSKR
jgi:hypothetical protein